MTADLFAKMSTFVRVVESGSFASAAKQLRISSAAVSRQISTLEADLHTTLLARTTRKMALTPFGRRYYERAVRILREVDDAQAAGTDDLDGLLRISAPVTFGLACVAPQMNTLMKRHPGLVVELHLEDRLVDLAHEGFDVAVRVGRAPPESTEIVARELVTYERALIASPRYLKKHGTPARPEALAKHDGLMHLTGATDTWTLRAGAREARLRPRIAFRSNALHAIRELATQGAGIALLPRWLVKDELATGALCVVLPDWRPDDVTAIAIHRREQRGVPRVRALIEHLRAAYADPNYGLAAAPIARTSPARRGR